MAQRVVALPQTQPNAKMVTVENLEWGRSGDTQAK